MEVVMVLIRALVLYGPMYSVLCLCLQMLSVIAVWISFNKYVRRQLYHQIRLSACHFTRLLHLPLHNSSNNNSKFFLFLTASIVNYNLTRRFNLAEVLFRVC